MKPKPNFDPDFPMTSRRRYWPIRSIGQLMIVVALSGLVLSVVSMKSQRPSPSVNVRKRLPMTSRLVQVPSRNLQARDVVQPPPDRFVIVARAEIDPAMVVQARPDIDPGMVFNPYTRRRGSAPSDPMPGVSLWELGQTPRPLPVPEQLSPRGRVPQYPVIPQPQPQPRPR
jgi:hypothetical protein